jgi:uncharacterized protein YggE
LVSHDVDDISSVLNALTAQGVNVIQGVDYKIENPEAFQAEAVKKATSYAKAKAQGMAAEFDVSLLSLVEVREDTARHQSAVSDFKSQIRSMSAMAIHKKHYSRSRRGLS